jgi:uncharacterized cupin superfamily protein
MSESFDLSKTFVHLGLGATAVPVHDFSWRPEAMRRYLTTFLSDRNEGRLVGITSLDKDWTHWERHAEGDELVVQLTGRSEVVQEIDGEIRVVQLNPGEAIVNPRGVWHTSNVQETGQSLFIAAGRRTDYRDRQR